jgi:hypothetical protein
MPSKRDKPLMRNLGEFVGHIVRAVKTDPKRKRQVVRKETEQEDRGSMVLRRTTIEEIEFRDMRR